MKTFLRKIFFWDKPTQGKFFALTLLFILPRFAFAFAFGNGITSKCRSMVRLERWGIRFALEENDMPAAQKALQRIDNISSAFLYDYGFIAGPLWGAIESVRADALAQILASGLADEQWLHQQAALLLEKERHIPLVHKRMIMGHAVCMMDAVDKIESSSTGLFLLEPEAWILLGREGAVLARCHCISDFADFPEKPAGIFARMLADALRNVGTKLLPRTLARLRISRAMIAAALARKRDGRYPDVMDDLPTDPFSGKPLKYAFGKFKIPEEHFQPIVDQPSLDISPAQKKQLGMTDRQATEFSRPKKYTFKTEWRTVEAVQLWSVGPDGKDNNGIRFPGKGDDIRYVMHPMNHSL